METTNLNRKIRLILLKDFTPNHTITSLAKELKITRTGMWKILKKLEKQQYIKLKKIGTGKTSTYIIKLNWNILTEKALALYLTEESLKQSRWVNNFEELKDKVDFLIIYGSILHNQEQANDIDIMGIAKKENLTKIEETIQKIQKIQHKKIHSINFTQKEFQQELENKNKAFIEAIKKGAILFGQEEFIQFMKDAQKKWTN